MDRAAVNEPDTPDKPVRISVAPASPFRLPRLSGGDRAFRHVSGTVERLLLIDNSLVVARASQVKPDQVNFSAEGVDPSEASGPRSEGLSPAGEEQFKKAIERMRFSTGVDDDFSEMAAQFRDDKRIGRAVRTRLHLRSMRRPSAWEAFAWGVTEQLIEYRRATSIQRRVMARWGQSARGLHTVPGPDVVAGLSPAELESAGLSGRRSIALIRCAREVTAGRVNLEDPTDDKRLLAIPEIGPWTIACLGLHGRGDPDALLAGDLSQVKLVGYMNGLGRLATVEEVEEFYLPYSPWRGWAGSFMVGLHGSHVRGAGSYQRIKRGPGRGWASGRIRAA